MAWQEVLKHEFNAEDGSFLLTLRTERRWDLEGFGALTRAMWECCRAHQDVEVLPRWATDGFWAVCYEARAEAEDPAFRKDFPAGYYARATELLIGLGFSFFSGTSAWNGEPPWA